MTPKEKPIDFRRMIKAAIAFITVLPVLLFVYLFNYDFHYSIPTRVFFISGTILFVGWIAILDLLLLYMLKLHIRSTSTLRKIDKKGLMEEPFIKSGVESLETLFNSLSSRVQESFDDLKNMSRKIEDLNEELAKKVSVLLAIMQIHEVFTQGMKEKEIFNFILEKLKEILRLNKLRMVLVKKEKNSLGLPVLTEEDSQSEQKFSTDQLIAMSKLPHILVIDSRSHNEKFTFTATELTLKNVFISPLYLQNNTIGFLVGGNCLEDFVFSKEDLDLINIFSKNIVLLWEHQRLSRAVEGLEIYDPLTSLYNKKHLCARLDEEIKRSAMYQRPCGLLIVKLTNLKGFQDEFGTIEAERLLKTTAETFRAQLRPIDIPARIDENILAAILIERNKRQCQTAIQKVKKVFADRFEGEKFKLEFEFAIGENPIDGKNTKELFDYTLANLKK
ncbi:MAG: diguanylate cyclase [Candidatus Omnitrophica bacterium]|nr:diguanylate cyclase [Candidatus Omnitrophota bacterium]